MGVDGSASNDCGSLLAETRLAYLLQRAQGTIEGTPQFESELAALPCQVMWTIINAGMLHDTERAALWMVEAQHVTLRCFST